MAPEVIDLLSSSPANAQAASRSRASQSIKISQKRIDELWNVIDNENRFPDDDNNNVGDYGGCEIASSLARDEMNGARARSNSRPSQDAVNQRVYDSRSSRERSCRLNSFSKIGGRNSGSDSASDISTPARGNDNPALRNVYLRGFAATHPESPIIISSPDERISSGRQRCSRKQKPELPPSSPPRSTPLSSRDRPMNNNLATVSPQSMNPVLEGRRDAFARSPIDTPGPDTWGDLDGSISQNAGTSRLHIPKKPAFVEKNKKGSRPSLECLDMTSPTSAYRLPVCRSGSPSSLTRHTRIASTNFGPKKSTLGQFFRVSKGGDGGVVRKARRPGPLAEVSGNGQKVAQRRKSMAKDEDDTIIFTSDAIDPTATNEETCLNQASHPGPLGVSHCGRPGRLQSTDSDSEDPIETSVSTTQASNEGSRTATTTRNSTETFFDIGNDTIGLSSDIDRNDGHCFDNDPEQRSENLSILEKIRKLNEESAIIKRKGRRKAPVKRKLDSIDADGDGEDDFQFNEDAVPATQGRISERRSTRPKITAGEQASRTAERERQKQAEKTARAEQRQAEKKERHRLKAVENERAEVNKRQKDRKKSSLEMIVDLPASFDDHMKELVKQCFDNAHIETSMVDGIVPNLITFRRKVTREWDSKCYTFRPLAQTIVKEPHVICVLKAKDFARRVEADARGGNESVDHLARSIDAAHPNYNQLYIIEGLNQFIKTRANRAQKRFADQVRGALTQSQVLPSSQGRRRVTQPSIPDVDEEQIEDALQHLEVEYFAKISHTSSPAETVTVIQRLTEYISTIRHSPEQTTLANARASFCLAAGQVSTGIDAREAYIKMLQHPGAITESLARDVARDYPGIVDLLGAFENQGPAALQDVERARNGQKAQRRVERLGKALSEKLCATMTGDNMHAFI